MVAEQTLVAECTDLSQVDRQAVHLDTLQQEEEVLVVDSLVVVLPLDGQEDKQKVVLQGVEQLHGSFHEPRRELRRDGLNLQSNLLYQPFL